MRISDWSSDVCSSDLDNLQLLRLAEKLEVSWRPPRSCLGGSDLALIRQLRNVLSHGSETFEAVGSQFSTSDISDKYARVRTFMVSLIRALERYRVRQLYRIDRKSDVEGKSGSVRVDLVGGRIIKKKKKTIQR